MNIDSHYDVVIVGAGLVGASLAAMLAGDLRNAALKIALIDKQAAPVVPDIMAVSPRFDPRVLALTPRSEQLLHDLGAWPKIVAQRACVYQNMVVWDDEGTGQVEFDAHSLQQQALGTIVENSIALEAVLQRVQQYSQIHVLRGFAVADFTHRQQQVDVMLDDGRQLSTDLLVAADGAYSKIRQREGLSVREWSYQQQAIVTTVKTEKHHQHTAWQNFRISGPLAFLPLGHASGQYSSIVWSVDTDQSAALLALTDTAFTDTLTRLSEGRLGEVVAVDKRHCVPLVQRHAINYMAEQLVLIGDAAHTLHPLAGQGVNLGLLDARALAVEIGRAQRRGLMLSEPSILRRYQRARKRHNLEMMLLMESFKWLFSRRQLPVRWLRNQGMHAVNHMQPVKNWLAKQAMGI